jgi:primosomal protein DnaI
MESIGESLRQWQKSESMEDVDRLAAKVMDDPFVLKLRSRYPELDDGIVRLNLNKLHQMAKEVRTCRDCPGLERCPNDMQGHFTSITCAEMGGRWQVFDHKTPCAKWIANEQQQHLRRRIRSLYVDETLVGDRFDETEMDDKDEDRSDAVHQLFDYVNQTKEDGLQKNGLYLMGGFGTGKTYLAAYMLAKLAKEGFSGVIVYMPEFVEDAKALMLEPHKLKETVALMKETDLLVFDDIGAENLNPWVRDHVIGPILNYRMNRKPTFYTSNHDLDSLEKHFSFTHKEGEEVHKGQRLMDRIKPFVEVVHVRGRNHRGR